MYQFVQECLSYKKGYKFGPSDVLLKNGMSSFFFSLFGSYNFFFQARGGGEKRGCEFRKKETKQLSLHYPTSSPSPPIFHLDIEREEKIRENGVSEIFPLPLPCSSYLLAQGLVARYHNYQGKERRVEGRN